jgi:nucleoside-diphosphate-sugar epimerase
MKIFVTGASGYIGRSVLKALASAGHSALALARSDAAAETVRTLGATPVRGALDELAVLRDAAAAADGVIHLGSDYGPKGAEIERNASSAMQEALGDRPYIHTGGVWIYGPTNGVVAEHAPTNPPAITTWRIAIERQVLTHPGHPVIVMPGVVYGQNAGLLQMLFTDRAKKDGFIPCVGDGKQHTTLIHVEDAADLYVRALGAPRGAVYAGVTECPTLRQIVDAIAKATKVPVRELSLGVAAEQMGVLAEPFGFDQQLTAARARKELGWSPRHTDAVAELAVTG